MKILGLKSVINCGKDEYEVIKITKISLSLRNQKGRVTEFPLDSIIENLNLGVMNVKSN